jgi:transposase InsO family protein
VLQVRENKLGKEFLYLIPKQCLLYKKVIEHFHRETNHGSDLYIRMWATRAGFYIPNALPALAKYRRQCIICKKRADVRVIVKQGHVGDRQLVTGFMETVCSDFCGPFHMKNPVNQRSTRKYWLMVSIDDMSRFITTTLVEDLSSKAILRAIQKHRYRFGPTVTIRSDMGTNYVGA